ncbi:MAG: hypothetical protein KGL39_03895 [Patescibacteria group bacterium]|nr:hypothetical protein [Patescibacteria group bacterium]
MTAPGQVCVDVRALPDEDAAVGFVQRAYGIARPDMAIRLFANLRTAGDVWRMESGQWAVFIYGKESGK